MRMASAHRALVERARQTGCDCPDAVLNLGAALAAHAAFESGSVELSRFLEDAVLEELFAEHGSLAEDIELLENLTLTDPRSSDIEALAAALVVRMRALLEREERLFYEPLRRLDPETAASSN